MISHKNILLSLAVVAGALLSSLCQAQKILTPQTPMNMPKPTATKPAPQRQEYAIGGGQFYDEAEDYGFNSSAHPKSFGSRCRISSRQDTENSFSVYVGHGQDFPGSKCDFTVFDGKSLKNGFVFKSYRGNKYTKGNANISMTSWPASGGTSIKFKFHGWDDPGDAVAIYTFTQFILEGPANSDWRDALR